MVAAITPFFNPSGYQRPVENHRRFKEAWKSSGVPLYTVECRMPGQPWQIEDDGFVFRCESEQQLWVKEAVMNYGAAHLDPKFEIIITVDCDLIWDHFDWLNDLPERMASTPFIHPWSVLRDTNEKGEVVSEKAGTGLIRRESAPGGAHVLSSEFFRLGGYFDLFLVGGGDTAFWYGVTGKTGDRYCQNIRDRSVSMFDAFESWCRKAHRFFRGEFSYCNVAVTHLWHGNRENRRYIDRQDILRGFNVRSVRRNEYGIPQIQDPEIARRINEYFHGRQEDGAKR